MKPSLLACPVILLGLSLAGCAGSGKTGSEGAIPLRAAQTLALFTDDGSPAPFDGLASTCAAADAVLIGEVHGHPQGLAFAADLWEAVLERTDHAALSMEFFERDQQAGLDDYLGGITDEAAFRKATGRTDSGYPAGHRRMVEAAKAASRPVMGANAPRRYVRVARLEGYERLGSLTPEQRRLFAAPAEMPSEAYHERFINLMSGAAADPSHAPGAAQQPGAPDPEAQRKTLEGFYRSQVLWDSTMAASIDGALASGLSPVVHVVGGFHVAEDGGTVQMLRQRRPGASIVTIAVVDADSSELREEDRGKADFIVYVGPTPDAAAR